MKNVLNPTLRDVLRSPFGDSNAGPPVPGDPLWADVAVVFNFQGPNGSTAVVDGKGHPVTYIGGAAISTAVYAEGALQVINSASKPRVQADSDSPDFELPADFCLEIEAYATTGNNPFYNVIFDTAGNGSGGGGLLFELSSIRNAGLVIGGSIRADAAANPNDGIKHRYCFDRNGSNLRFFRDGVLLTTATYSTAIASNGLSIGGFMNGVSTENWTGHIAAVRLTRASRYTTNHTPPALPFPEGP